MLLLQPWIEQETLQVAPVVVDQWCCAQIDAIVKHCVVCCGGHCAGARSTHYDKMLYPQCACPVVAARCPRLCIFEVDAMIDATAVGTIDGCWFMGLGYQMTL